MLENLSLKRYQTKFSTLCFDYSQKRLKLTVVILRLQKIEQVLINHRQKNFGNKPELTKEFTNLINKVIAKRIEIQNSLTADS